MCGGETGGDFGCPKCADLILERKHGWIECKSTSFPGKVYYFHTMTRCSTWRRPVPRNTRLPRYKKFRDSKSLESLEDDQILSSSLGVSGNGDSIFSSDVVPSDFELHARRMQIYLQTTTDYNFSMKYGRGEVLRDKLLECYKTAKFELAKKLKEKKQLKKPAKLSNVKPKTRPIDPIKTVRECHGITTVSYDPIPRKLPINVKMPDLSETSIDSFAPNQILEPSKICDKKFLASYGPILLKDLNLSESETTVNGVDFVQS